MYSGQSLQTLMEQGGYTYSQNIDAIPFTHFIGRSKNINLIQGGRTKRGGTSYRFGSAVSGTPQITGIHLYKQLDGDKFYLIGTADGKIYESSNLTTAIKTGLSANQVFQFETYNDKCYICNTANQVQVYNGVTISNLTNPAIDWGTTSPRQLLKHGRGNSERLWAIGVAGYRNRVYASADGSDNFVTGVVTFDISTVGGIVGGVDFGDRLLLFSANKTFVVVDTSATVTDWGYEEAQWSGGVASHRLIIRVPNDVICVTPDGDVYSVAAVEQYGDYKAASIARPAHIDQWIRDNVSLSTLATDAHGVYDPILRAIKIFVRRTGQSQADTCLLYFIDRPPSDAWVLHDNMDYASGYKASVSGAGEDTSNNTKILTGDYSGRIWQLEDTTKSDNGNGYYAGFITPHSDFGNAVQEKRYDRLHIVTKPEGNFNLTIKVYIDAEYRKQTTMNLGSVGAIYGIGVYGTAVYGGEDLLQDKVDLKCIGTRIGFEIFNQGAAEDFFISRLIVDHKPLGNKGGY